MKLSSLFPILPLGFMLIALTFSVLTYLNYTKVRRNNDRTPKFKVGECFIHTFQREEWDPPPTIYMVLQIGKANYKTCFVETHCNEVLNGDTAPHTSSFIYDNDRKKVNCSITME